MPQVICTLQNMSGSVSGVAFTRAPEIEGLWISEDVSDDVAALFAEIPGYARRPESKPSPEPPIAPPTTPAPPESKPDFPSRKGK